MQALKTSCMGFCQIPLAVRLHALLRIYERKAPLPRIIYIIPAVLDQNPQVQEIVLYVRQTRWSNNISLNLGR